MGASKNPNPKPRKPPGPSEQELQRKHARFLLVVNQLAACTKLLLVVASVVGFGYVTFYLPVAASAGQETTISVMQKWIADVHIMTMISWGATGTVACYAIFVRRKWLAEREEKDRRIADLEKLIDPGRTSSEVTAGGDPMKK